MEQADLHVHEYSKVDVPINRSVNQDKVFTDDPEGSVQLSTKDLFRSHS